MSDQDSAAVLQGHEQDPQDNDYATPPKIWRPLARAVGGFDVDPASGAEPVPIASTRFTKADNGLRQPWHGAVWLNPPWSSTGDGSAKETWLRKARNEASRDDVDVVVGVLPADTSAHWWHDHVMAADALCLVGPGRIPFIGEDRNPSFALALFAFGEVTRELLDAMNGLGSVLVDGARHDPAPQTRFGGDSA